MVRDCIALDIFFSLKGLINKAFLGFCELFYRSGEFGYTVILYSLTENYPNLRYNDSLNV